MARRRRFPLVRLTALVGLLAFTLLSLAGCHEESAGERDDRPEVKVARPLTRDVHDYSYFTGRTEAIESVNLQAKVTGFLKTIDYVSGTKVDVYVKKNQRLFKIDPAPYQALYDQAQAQVNLAKARLTLAIADYKRAKEVAKTPGAISQQDIDKYAAAEGEAMAEVDAMKANLESAALNLGYTNVTSPMDGRVGRNLISIGDLVKQNETLLATMVSQDPIYVYFDVDDRTQLRIKRLMQEGKIKTREQGGKFPIDVGLSDEGDEYPHRGELDYVSPQLDPTTGTIQVRGVYDNPEVQPGGPRLLDPATFVRVRISLGPPYPALLVPQAALGTDQGKKYLLVVTDIKDKKDVVEYRPVNVGPQEPGGMQVVVPVPMVKTEEGLRPATFGPEKEVGAVPSITKDDRVIIDGLQSVHPTMLVKPKLTELTMPAAKTEPAVKAKTTPTVEKSR